MPGIDDIRTRLARDLADIEARNLPSDIKQELAARAWHTAATHAQTLRDEAIKATIEARTQHRRAAFHRPPSLSYRDARSYAATEIKTPADALAVLREADDTGDEDMAVAIARQAHKYATSAAGDDWKPVVTAYAATRPHVRDALDHLSKLADPDDAVTKVHLAKTYGIPKPAAIANLRDDQIRNLVERRTDVA